jgi:HSP20 family molecular chaperone IbpA
MRQMTTSVPARRRFGPADLLDWLESAPPIGLRGIGLSSQLRMEDFVEDGVYVLRAEVPGIDPAKDVEVSITGDTLTVKGERREEKKDRRLREFHYGSFYRSVRLPGAVDADKVTATYGDGVLEIRVPVGSAEADGTTIPVIKTA